MPIDLKRITKGRLQLAPRILVYAFDGVGKTQFAAGAPKPFFLDPNRGSGAFDVERIFFDAWDDAFEWIGAIESGQVKCDTVVLDTASDFEAMSHAKLFPGTTVTKAEGGFNKGDDVVIAEWRRLIYRLERVWEQGKGVIITAHARVKGYVDPLGPSYDRYEVALRAPLAGLLRGWCDYVFFAQVQTGITVSDKGKGSNKGTTTGERFMFTRRTPAYDAKARGTAAFPERLPLSYSDFAIAVENDGKRVDLMQAEIQTMLAEIGDAALVKQVGDYLKRNPTQIADAHNRVKIRLSEKKATEEQAATPQGPQPQPAATAAS